MCYIKLYILIRFLHVLVNFIQNLIMMSPLIRDLYNYNIRVVCAGNVKIDKRVQSVKIILMVVLGTMFVDEIFFVLIHLLYLDIIYIVCICIFISSLVTIDLYLFTL